MMKDLTNINWRVGFRMDIVGVLNDLEEEFECNLNATIDSYDFYDEVSTETLSDLAIVTGKLAMLLQLGYINEDEYNEMVHYADDIRSQKLEKLEKEPEDENKETYEKEGEENGEEINY